MSQTTHLFARNTRCALATLVALMLYGCGGGSATDKQAPPAGATLATYRDTNLPGRMLVNSPFGRAVIFDLRDGNASGLPASGIRTGYYNPADGDRWVPDLTGARLLRWNDTQTASDDGPGLRLSVFDAASLAPLGAGWRIPGRVSGDMLVSPDGLYVMAFYAVGIDDPTLSIMSLESGQLVKQGSQLDATGDSILSTPAAWLPGGRYVYMVGNQFYTSSPSSSTSSLAATLSLPSNYVFKWEGYLSGQSKLSVSPDGLSVAFTWNEQRGDGFDQHIWVAKLDGSGLHRLTSPPDSTDPLTYRYASPSWSPDGKWVSGVLDMHATIVLPTYPPPDSDPSTYVPQITVASTGCANSQVFALPVAADRVALTWPMIDKRYGLKVHATPSDTGAWLTTCSPVSWLK